jgi:hypothetical protein
MNNQNNPVDYAKAIQYQLADIGTKAVTSTALERHMDAINMVKLKPTIN